MCTIYIGLKNNDLFWTLMLVALNIIKEFTSVLSSSFKDDGAELRVEGLELYATLGNFTTNVLKRSSFNITFGKKWGATTPQPPRFRHPCPHILDSLNSSQVYQLCPKFANCSFLN